jgi:hypothetical protein
MTLLCRDRRPGSRQPQFRGDWSAAEHDPQQPIPLLPRRIRISACRAAGAGIDEPSVGDERSVLLESLGADVDLVAQDLLDLSELVGEVPIEVVGVSANGNGHPVFGPARGAREGDVIVRGDSLADAVKILWRHSQPRHCAELVAEPLG